MSRKIPEQQYEKTISYRFRQWLDGTKDPFLGTVEMKPQKEFHEDDTAVEKRKEEKKEILHVSLIPSTMRSCVCSGSCTGCSVSCSVSVLCLCC